LVLSDGKAGHLNQSLAVAEQIRRARMTQGYKMEDTSVCVVKVEYKNKLLRLVLAIAAPFAGWRCHGRMRVMRFCLEKESYENLMKTYAEFIVSCGSSLAGVNIFMKKENNAKNVVVMKPGIMCCLKKFNFMIIPKHDRMRVSKNIVVTSLAPNLVDEKALEIAARTLRGRVNIEKEKVIGLLIGGDNPEYRLSSGILRRTLSDILKICEANDAELLVTTSRRTGKYQEAVIKSALHGQERCKLLVIANEDNPQGTLPGILALSDVAVVSGESISMVSEAVSSGKKTVVFGLEKKSNRVTKHDRILENLSREKHISIARTGEIISLVGRALKDTTPPKKIDDTEKIYEAMRALI
jgi:mitochondrial fission protein ELM1